jgi:hypothetical protein
MKAKINDFTFKGLMAKHAIKDMQLSGLLRSPAASAIERSEHDFFAPVTETIRAGSIEMARNYRLLYVFENLVRDFINSRFTEEDKTTEWFETRSNTEMKKKVVTRKKGEEKHQWHTGRNEGPLYYLDFSDLSLLIINHWAVFKDFFPKQSWVTTRIDEAERSRNVIAHTNLLSSEESLRLEMYLNDWIKQIA